MPSTFTLAELGWDNNLENQFGEHRALGRIPGRVAIHHGHSYRLYTEMGELNGEIPGKLRFAASTSADLPVVGDWVALETDHGTQSIIRTTLQRRGVLSRKVAWTETEEQILASNVDVVFVITGADGDVNPRRIERYLAVAYEAGTTPVVVLTKIDLADDVDSLLESLEAVAIGVPVHAVNNLTGEGVDGLREHLADHKTAVLLGSSGVGKSSLINQLIHTDRLRVAEVRWDGKGRHTTTHRELVLLDSGGMLIDTPGMRELQLWEVGDGLETTFGDVTGLAASCRFTDCTHDHEPGCAVRAAVRSGALPRERLDSYNKLQRELRYLEMRLDKRQRSEESKKWKKVSKQMRNDPRVRAKSR